MKKAQPEAWRRYSHCLEPRSSWALLSFAWQSQCERACRSARARQCSTPHPGLRCVCPSGSQVTAAVAAKSLRLSASLLTTALRGERATLQKSCCSIPDLPSESDSLPW